MFLHLNLLSCVVLPIVQSQYMDSPKAVDYANKIILAPMVRMNTLPFRLLSLDYGADLVYSEELIDFKLVTTQRKVNDVLNTIDFIDPLDGSVVFRTCAREKDKVILQLGTADPERALEAAKLVENDVAGIDINMGCPKEFSLKGGMGAALLTNPKKACEILTTLVHNLKIPVTCKVRILSNVEDTVKLVKQFEDCGISAIAVHGRTKSERPRHPNKNYVIKLVTQHLKIPVIANGGSKDISSYEDILKFKNATNCSSVMIARAAQDNCSIFSNQGVQDVHKMIKDYLKYCIDFDNHPSNSKYCVQSMLGSLQETPRGKKFLECQSLEQICNLWDLNDYFKMKKELFSSEGLLSRWDITPPAPKKAKISEVKSFLDENNALSLNCAFLRNLYSVQELPKTILYAEAKFHRFGNPKYETVQNEKLFRSSVIVNNKKYTSTFWEKNKRFAEQGAAIVCLCALGIYTEDSLRQTGVLR